KPSHIDVVGDRAYVVGPANYAYKEKGKSVKEVGSVFTIALQKSTSDWRIIGWAWAKHYDMRLANFEHVRGFNAKWKLLRCPAKHCLPNVAPFWPDGNFRADSSCIVAVS